MGGSSSNDSGGVGGVDSGGGSSQAGMTGSERTAASEARSDKDFGESLAEARETSRSPNDDGGSKPDKPDKSENDEPDRAAGPPGIGAPPSSAAPADTAQDPDDKDDNRDDRSFVDRVADTFSAPPTDAEGNARSTSPVADRINNTKNYSVDDIKGFFVADEPPVTPEQSRALEDGAAVMEGLAIVPANMPATGPIQGTAAYDAAVAMANAEFGVGMQVAYRDAGIAADKNLAEVDQQIADVDARITAVREQRAAIQSNPNALEGPLGHSNTMADLQSLQEQERSLTENRAALETERAAFEASRNLPNAIDMAYIARDVYNQTSALEGSHLQRMSRADLEAQGFNTSLLDDPETGFSAEVYRNAVTDQVVLAYEGTTFDSVEDWKANVGQGAGLPTKQYEQAALTAVEFDEAFAGHDKAITGHSLGGGQAGYGSLATGIDATTFNAAGLSENSLERLGITREQAGESVTAYNVDGDILNMVQDSRAVDFGLRTALGMPGNLLPDDVVPEAVGTRHQHAARTSTWDLPDWSGDLGADAEQALDLHSIEAQIHTLWSEHERRIRR